MPQKSADATIAQQVELAIGRVSCISTLPSAAARFLGRLSEFQLSPSELADIIEADPAFAVMSLSLMGREGIDFAAESFSINQVLEKLPLHTP